MPVTETPITRLRDRLGPAFSEAVSGHRPQFIERNGREHGLLLGYDEARHLVAAHEFHPEVLFEEGAVSIWLPEFALYGRGADLAEATEDLLDEVRAYVDEYLEEPDLFLRAPNRGHHFPFVLKAALADLGGDLEQVLGAHPHRRAAAAA